MLIFLFLTGWLTATWGNEEFSESRSWLNLVHYQKTFSGFKSEADGPGFFISSEGKTDPAAELKATIAALNDPTQKFSKLKLPAACVFTARKKVLEKEGHRFPKVECPEYEAWRKGLPVTNLSIIFATAYPNNPASMFGHTFLRLNGPGEGNNLLDYAVNFAATTGTDGGIEFALWGVFGGYEGHYSLAPYFIKVNEYNHGEARDLWEYPLKLKADAIDILLAHLWEIEATGFFDYYFFDENCSWQILRLLEAADPELELSSKMSFYIIPGDTIKVLSQNDLIQDPIFRPSLRRQYRARGKPKTRIEEMDKKLHFYRLRARLGKTNARESADYHSLLEKRAKDPSSEYIPNVPAAKNRPDLGHGLRRVSIGIGDGFRRLSAKFAQHDLLDHDLGHESWSGLDVGRISIEEKNLKVFVRELTLVDVTSLHESDDLDFEPSWFLKISGESPREFACINCFTSTFRGGLGKSLRFLDDQIMTGLFMSGRTYGAHAFKTPTLRNVAHRAPYMHKR